MHEVYPALYHCISHWPSTIKFILSLAPFSISEIHSLARCIYVCACLSASRSSSPELTLYFHDTPPCLVTVRVPVTSPPYCRGGKRLDSREFREKNFLIRVHKRFASSRTTFRRRKNVLYARGFSVTKCRTKCERARKPRRTLILAAYRSHTFPFLSKDEFSDVL